MHLQRHITMFIACTFTLTMHVCSGRRTRYRYILTVKDHFTRYTWLRLIEDKQCATVAGNVGGEIESSFYLFYWRKRVHIYVADCMRTLFRQYNHPRILHTDNGGEFCGHEMQALLQLYNIKHITGAPYHSQTQGSVEVANRITEQRLAALIPTGNMLSSYRDDLWWEASK